MFHFRIRTPAQNYKLPDLRSGVLPVVKRNKKEHLIAGK